MTERIGVVLMNLGGPDGPDAVEPFLFNLFSDPAILRLPGFLRNFIARRISRKRAPEARAIYDRMGGRSPILPQTEDQARALEAQLEAMGVEARCLPSMRYWRPFSYETVREFLNDGIDRVVLLPLYPQFSTTTTASSVCDWLKAAKEQGLEVPVLTVGCYPADPDFIAAHAAMIRDAVAAEGLVLDNSVRILFSAHGLPERIVAAGDPYPDQVAGTVAAIVKALNIPDLDMRICYQSRVGPLKWIGPATDDEIERAGRDGKALIVVPVAFVSEHSETLVELDIDYRALAKDKGVPHYVRVPALATTPAFIDCLAKQVIAALAREKTPDHWNCPADKACACRAADQRDGFRKSINSE